MTRDALWLSITFVISTIPIMGEYDPKLLIVISVILSICIDQLKHVEVKLNSDMIIDKLEIKNNDSNKKNKGSGDGDEL